MSLLHSRFRYPCAAIMVAIALCGCTRDVAGVASRAAGSVTSDGVDLEMLQTGNYPTEPLPPYGTASDLQDGEYLEGARLAANVLLPSDVDPGLINAGPLSAGVMVNPTRLRLFTTAGGEEARADFVAAAETHGFLLGFASRRTGVADGELLQLTDAVLIFPDDGAARAASADIAAAHSGGLPERPSTPQSIPGRPDTVAFSQTDPDGVDLYTYTPHDNYVLYHQASARALDRTVDLVTAALGEQEPLIDRFEATAPDAYIQLPVDPTGLLARTIPVPDADRQLWDNFVYSPAAALHFQGDPVRSKELFDDVGVVRVAYGMTTVYETSFDDGGARLIAASAETPTTTVPSAGIEGMPNVECSRLDIPTGGGDSVARFYCAGSAGRYAFEAQSDYEVDVHQQMAAQYLMLTAP